MSQRETRRGGRESHDHSALFYEGDQEYLDGVTHFAAPALEAGEPVVAAVPPERGRLLRDSAPAVRILDIFELGRNPARIIPEVEALLGEYGGAGLHMIGEPAWEGRSPEEIREVSKHEALVNLAWPDAPVRALCPYDAAALGPEVLDSAERTHPLVIRHGAGAGSELYREGAIPSGCEQPLQLPPDGARAYALDRRAPLDHPEFGAGRKRIARSSARSRTTGRSRIRWPDEGGLCLAEPGVLGCGWSTSCATSSRSAAGSAGRPSAPTSV